MVATAWACCIFGAVTGSGAATNVAIGKSAVPEYKKRGYDLSLSLGALACSGTLGFLIPPSIPLAVYGILTEQSIGRLFIGGSLRDFSARLWQVRWGQLVPSLSAC